MWKSYLYDHNAENCPPLRQPDEGEDTAEMMARLGLTWSDDEIREVGFDPANFAELWISVLASEWHGHPAGARFISQDFAEGLRFAVEI